MAEVNLDNATMFVDFGKGPQNYVASEELRELVQSRPADDVKEEPETSLPEKSKRQRTIDCITIHERKIKCPECHRYKTDSEEKMLRHIRKVHRGENPFQCYMCDYSTYNKCLFEEHVRIHQGIKPFKCSFCPYRSVSKKNTKKHELIHRPNNPLKCQDCDFIARNKRSLACHKSKHVLPPCTESSYEADNKVPLKLHQQKDKGPYNCAKCEFSTNSSIALRNHRKSTRCCKKCQFTACRRSEMTQHMEKVHHDFLPKMKKIKNDKLHTFKCSICKWSSSGKAKILLHLIHHPDQEVDEDVVDISILKKYGIMSG